MKHLLSLILFGFAPVLSIAQDGLSPDYLKRMADSCAALYNQQSLQAFVEKYKGQEVWLGDIKNGRVTFYWKEKIRRKVHNWYEAGGNASANFQSSIIGSFNDLKGTNCILYDLVLMPNKDCTLRVQSEDEKWHTLSSGWGNIMFKYNQFQTLRYGTEKFPMYRYYAVFTMNPQKIYIDNRDTITTQTADTLYVEYTEKLYKYVRSNDEFLAKLEKCKKWDEEQWSSYNKIENARYKTAKSQWGEHIAQKIRRGLVEFGFSSEMCLAAIRDEPYHIDKIMTPLGLATQYDFYLNDLKLFFIEDKLIGIQYPNRHPHFYQ